MTAIIDKANAVRLMGFDIDGVMTDGRLYFGPDGDQLKAFFSRDGLGLRMLMRCGIEVAIITGRNSPMVARRAENLGIKLIRQGVEDKRETMGTLLDERGFDFSVAGYMGDDVIDLGVMTACRFSATVPDGHPLVLRQADFLAKAAAGAGAVREVCEFILNAQGLWGRALEPYR